MDLNDYEIMTEDNYSEDEQYGKEYRMEDTDQVTRVKVF